MLAQPVYQQLSGWGLPAAASKADNPWGPRHDVGRRRGSEDDAAAGFWPVNNPNLVSWYFAWPPVVKGCKAVNKKHHQASLRACKGFYRAANRSIKWKQGKKTTLLVLYSHHHEGKPTRKEWHLYLYSDLVTSQTQLVRLGFVMLDLTRLSSV